MAVVGQDIPSILLEKPIKAQISALVNSIYKAFQGIEPWYHAEMIEHGLPQATVNRIIAQGDKYIIAIQEIVQTVGDGTTFAKDIVALCPEDGRSIIIISKIPESTHQIAETSYRATSQTCGQLRSIRKALSEIIERIGSHMSTKLSKNAKSAQAVVIRLPTTINDDQLSKSEDIVEVMPLRGMEPKTIEEAMEQLKKVEKDVLGLVTQVDEFMAWWDWARSSLNNMQRQDGTNRRLVLDIRSFWEKILAQYRKNTNRVDAIRSWKLLLTASAVPSTSIQEPLSCNQPSTHVGSKSDELEESKGAAYLTVDKAFESSAAELILQLSSQPTHIRLLSSVVSTTLEIVQSAKGATNAGDLKLIATNACRLVCVVLKSCAQKRSYGKKMPKDFDSSLQDLVNTLVDVNNFTRKPEACLPDAHAGEIREYHEKIIQVSSMFSQSQV